jgi:hypothetical protein
VPNLNCGRKKSKNVSAASEIFKKTSQSKQSPIGRKFAKSGHPVCDCHSTGKKGFGPPKKLKKKMF